MLIAIVRLILSAYIVVIVLHNAYMFSCYISILSMWSFCQRGSDILTSPERRRKPGARQKSRSALPIILTDGQQIKVRHTGDEGRDGDKIQEIDNLILATLRYEVIC
jgi:hypothetical protein